MSKLMFTQFSVLDKWYIEQYLRKAIKGRFPMISLSKILKPIRVRVNSQDYNQDIPLVAKIRFSDGQIFYRVAQPKNHVFLAHKGDLLVSNINFEKGAFCIVDKETVACSTDYQPYKIIYLDILPEYLNLCLRSDTFLKNVAEAKPKGMKTRAKWDFIKTFSIPVPSRPEQSEMVSNYNKLIEKSENTLFDYISGVNAQLTQTYNLKTDLNSDSNILKFADFKEMFRWDVENISSKVKVSANVPLRRISEFVKSWMEDENGSLAFNSMDYKDEYFSYLGMENVDKNTGKIIELPNIKGKDIKSTTLRVPEGYIIYNKLRPYLNKYWVNDEAIDKVICSSEFFVFETYGINKEYFIYVLSSSFVQKQMEIQYSGARMPRINKDVFLNVKIPVPNKEEQERIVQVLNCIKQDYEQKKVESKELETKAKQDFENTIFGE